MWSKVAVIKAVLIDYTVSGFQLLLSLAVTPLFFRYISQTQYGLFLGSMAFVQMFGLIDFAVDNYILKYSGSEQEVRRTTRNLITIKLITLLTFFCIMISYLAISGNSSVLFGCTLLNIVELFIGFFFAINLNTCLASVAACGKMGMSNLIQGFVGVLIPIFSILLIGISKDLNALFLAYVLANIVGFLIFILFFKEGFTFFSLTLSSLAAKEIFRYSTKFQMLRVANIMRQAITPLFVSQWSGAASLTLYNTNTKLPGLAGGYMGKLTSGIYPKIAQINNTSTSDHLAQVFEFSFGLNARLTLFGTIVFVGFNKHFIDIWLGKNFEVTSVSYLLISIYFFITQIVAPCGNVVYAKNSFGKWGLASFGEVCVVISSFCFLFILKIVNLDTIFIALCLGASLNSAYQIGHVSRILGMRNELYISVFKVLLNLLPLALYCMFISYYFVPQTWTTLGLELIPCFLLVVSPFEIIFYIKKNGFRFNITNIFM